VDKTLSLLARDGILRRLGRGIYDYPRRNPELGGQLSAGHPSVVLRPLPGSNVIRQLGPVVSLAFAEASAGSTTG
jgi:hypothetical protein